MSIVLSPHESGQIGRRLHFPEFSLALSVRLRRQLWQQLRMAQGKLHLVPLALPLDAEGAVVDNAGHASSVEVHVVDGHKHKGVRPSKISVIAVRVQQNFGSLKFPL
jgi:hypothetical protein